MNRCRTITWMATAAAIGVLGIVQWKTNRARDDASRRARAAESRTLRDAQLLLSVREPPRMAAGEVVTEIPPTHAALVALVSERLREWENDDDPARREERTRELENLFARDGNEIFGRLKIIEALPAGLANFAFGLPTFQQWMFANPNAALDWMSGRPEISSARVLTLFQDWGQKDRKALRLYLDGLPAGDWKEKALAAASYEALPTDPVEAISRAQQLRAAGPQTGLLELATAEWTRRDAVAASRWVGQLNNPPLREALVGSLAVGYADAEPDSAASWAASLLPTGKNLDRAAAEIAGAWARQDPAAAAAWVVRFPAGNARQMALGNLLNAWSNRDQAAAAAWVRGLPDETLRAQAAEFLGGPASL